MDKARQSDTSEVRSELERVSKSEREQRKYIVWITEVFRNLEVWAVDHGLQLPPAAVHDVHRVEEERPAGRVVVV